MIDFTKLVWNGLEKLSAYVPGKPIAVIAEEYKLDRVIKLASNENPYGPSPRAIASLEEYKNEISRYPIGDSLYLRRKIAAHHNVSPDNILCGAGSDEVIQLLYMAFLDRGLHAMSYSPSFSEYELLAKSLKASCVWVKGNDDFTVNFDNILNSINENTRFIMLANPNNPTGTAFSHDDFSAFLKKVPETVLVVLDEAYIEFADTDITMPDVLSLMKEHDNLMTMRTFSKAYGLASIRVGYLIAHKDLIALLNRIRPPFNVSSAAQIMAEAALSDQAYIKDVVSKNDNERKYLYSEFEKMGLSFVKSHANFILVHVGDGKSTFDKLLKRGIIARFLGDESLKEYIRVSIGTHEENEAFIKELREVLK